MRRTHDKLGRVKFTPHTQNPIEDFKPNRNQIEWMRFINRHGPLSSEYLYELTRDKLGNRHNFSEAIKQLYDGMLVYKPLAQRSTETPDGNFHIYDLTEKGKRYLIDAGFYADALRPTGKFEHQFMVSTITATIDIMCQRNGYRYIPPHEYLNGAEMGQVVPFKWGTEPISIKLIPDAVFAIDYGDGSFIAYFLEADRNTEPHTAKDWRRKSDLRTLRQYKAFIGDKLYKKLYKRDAMAVLLFVTVAEGHARNFVTLADEEIGKSAYVAVGLEDAFRDPFFPPKLLTHIFDGPLTRPGKEPFYIKMNPN